MSVAVVADPQKAKEREERMRLNRERREQAELKRLEELRESIARHQEIRRKQEEERRRRMDEMKKREEEHRALVEERRKRLQGEENVREPRHLFRPDVDGTLNWPMKRKLFPIGFATTVKWKNGFTVLVAKVIHKAEMGTFAVFSG